MTEDSNYDQVLSDMLEVLSSRFEAIEKSVLGAHEDQARDAENLNRLINEVFVLKAKVQILEEEIVLLKQNKV